MRHFLADSRKSIVTKLRTYMTILYLNNFSAKRESLITFGPDETWNDLHSQLFITNLRLSIVFQSFSYISDFTYGFTFQHKMTITFVCVKQSSKEFWPCTKLIFSRSALLAIAFFRVDCEVRPFKLLYIKAIKCWL